MTRRSGLLRMAWKAALAFGLLGVAVWMNRKQIAEVRKGQPDRLAFSLGMVAYLGGLTLAFWRWFLLVRAAGLPFRFRDAVRLGLIGALFNFVIPGAVFGNVVKAGFLCREHPARRPAAIASVVVDFLCGLLGLFLLASCVGLTAWRGLDPPVRNLVYFACAASVVAAGALSYAVLSKKGPCSAYRGRGAILGLGVLLGIATHALNVLAFFAVTRALFGASVPGLAAHFLIVPLVLLTTAVPVPFGGLGVAEQASFALFHLMRYDGGAVAMLGFRLLQFAGAGIGAAVYLANARQVRELVAGATSSAPPLAGVLSLPAQVAEIPGDDEDGPSR